MDASYTVGIVGATGAVGREIIECLSKRKGHSRLNITELKLFVSERSAGQKLTSQFGELLLEEFSVKSARTCDFVFLAVSGEFAQRYVPEITKDGGPIVIDNSSAFRYESHVPLVVPEINAKALQGARIVANPNCTTAIAAMALWPLHQRFSLRKIIISTYQAASGAGSEGITELIEGTAAKLQGEDISSKVFAHPLPFNLIPHIDKFQENGYTKEEMKVVWEMKKIFGLSDEVKISCTAVRIPTIRAHSESISIETEKQISVLEARTILSQSPGVRLMDDPLHNIYPMPLTASSKDDVEVGRIRQSLVFGDHGLDFFVCGDQLLRGAALNAVLIAETMTLQQTDC